MVTWERKTKGESRSSTTRNREKSLIFKSPEAWNYQFSVPAIRKRNPSRMSKDNRRVTVENAVKPWLFLEKCSTYWWEYHSIEFKCNFPSQIFVDDVRRWCYDIASTEKDIRKRQQNLIRRLFCFCPRTDFPLRRNTSFLSSSWETCSSALTAFSTSELSQIKFNFFPRTRRQKLFPIVKKKKKKTKQSRAK